MLSAPSWAAGLALCAVIVLPSGLWLNRHTKPYGVAVLTVHKLATLAGVVLIFTAVNQANRAARLPARDLVVAIVTGLAILTAMASGGLLSTCKPTPSRLLLVHRLASSLAGLAAVVIAFLAVSRAA